MILYLLHNQHGNIYTEGEGCVFSRIIWNILAEYKCENSRL